MGEAKRKGTFEDRKSESITRKNERWKARTVRRELARIDRERNMTSEQILADKLAKHLLSIDMGTLAAMNLPTYRNY